MSQNYRMIVLIIKLRMKNLISPLYMIFNILEWIGLSLTQLINGYKSQRININIIEYKVKNDE